MDKFTKGPWKDGPVFQKEGRAIFHTDTLLPGKWQQRLDDKSGVFTEADARLIAAAPDMFEALAGLLDMLEGGAPLNTALARAALAKARGQ